MLYDDVIEIPKGSRFKDLTGEKFGRLTVVGYAGKNKWNEANFWCICECGRKTRVKSKGLTAKKNGTKSCGCLSVERSSLTRNYKDMAGEKFGRLTVVKYTGRVSYKNYALALWLCKCDCGNEVIVRGSSLRNGNTKSCGCLDEERRSERKGEDHPNWRFDLTEKERQEDRKFNPSKIKVFREGVYEKDNYTCQCCGNRSRKGHPVVINAHHLNGYHWFKEGRYDIKNGATLCNKCHREFHKIYGMRDNTKQQFEDFISDNQQQFSISI